MANKKRNNRFPVDRHDLPLFMDYNGNIYAGGGILGALTGANKAMDASKLGGLLGGASGISGIAGGIASAASNAISGGMSTGVGGAMQTIGGLASNIPGVGGLIGAGVNVLGGVVNRAFGSQINDEFVDQTKQNVSGQLDTNIDDSSFDSVIQQQMDNRGLDVVSRSQVGKDGWFSNKAKNLTSDLNKKIKNANDALQMNFNNAFGNVREDQRLDLLANYSAYGGSLFADGGGIHIKNANRGKFTSYCGGNVTSECIARGKRSSSPTIRKRATFAANARKWHADGGNLFSQGGPKRNWDNTLVGKLINHAENRDSVGYDRKYKRWYAPPKGKGYDTNNRGMGVDIRRNPHIGGKIKTDKRGSYISVEDERNARFQSISDAENSYNARLDYAKRVTGKKGTPSEKKKALTMSAIYNMGATEVANKLFENKELMRSLMSGTDDEYANQVHEYYKSQKKDDRIKAEKKFLNLKAEGGILSTHGADFSNGITIIGEGGTHEQNPNEGVQMGVDPQGVPNLVEEGEVLFNDYVFSNRLKVPKKDRKRLKLREGTFADVAKRLQKESSERPNDPISKRGLEVSMGRLAEVQEGIRERKNRNKYAEGGPYKTYKNFENVGDDWYAPEYMSFVNSLQENDPASRAWLGRINSGEFGPVGGNIFTDISDIQRLATDRKKGPVHNAMSRAAQSYRAENSKAIDVPMAGINTDYRSQIPNKLTASASVPESASTSGEDSAPTWMRYAPVVGAGLGVIGDMFRGTDYSNADSIRDSYKATPDIGFKPVGNKLTYRPLDTNYMINRLDANTAAQRRALLNTSGGNRATAAANIIAANNNYGNQLGDLYRQAEEYNQAQKERVEGFNRQTNIFNSEGQFRAAASNQQSRAANADRRFRNAATVAQMREGINNRDTARRDANISNLLQGLGDIGYENFGMNMANSNNGSLYRINNKGNVSYKSNKRKKGGRILK